METAINYIIESSLSLGLMTMFYRAWLKRRPVMWFNRLYLLLALSVSAIIPFIHFTLQQRVYQGNVLPEVEVGTGYYLLNTITIWGNATQSTLAGYIHQVPWLKMIYLTGLIILLIKLVFNLNKIQWFKRKGTIEDHSGFVLVDTGNETSPFSFFRLLFVNRKCYQPDELDVIIHHELSHIRLKHSYDILLLELILIIQWFNPFAWLLRRDLKEIHEFQADQGTLQAGANPAHYRQLLVYQAMGTRFDLGHNFSQSLIKKRLNMMNSNFNKSLGFIKPVAALALIAVLVMAFGYDQLKNSEIQSDTQELAIIQTTNPEIVAPEPEPVPPVVEAPSTAEIVQPVMEAQVPPKIAEPDTTTYEKVDVMPEFPGGLKALSSYLSTTIKYPVEAQEKTIQGKVFVSFVVSKTGEVIKASIVRSVDPLLDQEALRVVNAMPKWKPGVKDQKEVNVRFTLPINFHLTKESKPLTTTNGEKDVFLVVEEMPSFPGGQEAMMDYLKKNIIYPAVAQENNWTGKVFVSFVVKETGIIDDTKVIRGSGHEVLDQEAIRIIKSMPTWQPGKQNGKTVNVQFTLPVNFALQRTNDTDKYGVIVLDVPAVQAEEMKIHLEKVQPVGEKKILVCTISGTNDQPIVGASVVVEGTTRGTVSKSGGLFSLEVFPEDKNIVFSFVGKKTLVVPVQTLTN